MALAAVLLAPGIAWGAFGGGAGFDSGQWRLGSEEAFEERRVNGFRAFAQWLPGDFRLTAGYRFLREEVIDVVGRGGPEGARHQNHLVSALGGWEQAWFHLAIGAAGWRGEDFGDPLWLLRPAGRLRAGPRDWIYLEASAFDVSDWSIGPGAYKAGLGAQPGGARVFVGVAGDWNERLAGSVAGAMPLGGGVALDAGAGIDAREPGHYLLVEAGLSGRWGP